MGGHVLAAVAVLGEGLEEQLQWMRKMKVAYLGIMVVGPAIQQQEVLAKWLVWAAQQAMMHACLTDSRAAEHMKSSG